MQHTESNNNLIFKFLLASILVYSLMGIFAGLPEKANLTAFIVGLVVLFLVLVIILSVSWIILVKPLPENLAPSKQLPVPHNLRQGIALFLTLMALIGSAGGFWDVAWHVRSGLPFGEDFFWAPHQFIYASLIAPVLVAAFLWYRVLRFSSGTLRQRFKADIPVTLIIIGGVAMLFTVPADPIWHVIYGEDVTGLSVPHLIFSFANTLLSIGAMSILLSYVPERKPWESVFKISAVEILSLLLMVTGLYSLVIPTLGDWEALTLTTSALDRLPALVASRPDWAMPFLAAFVATYAGSMALQIIKCVGTATLLWGIATVVRGSLLLVFGYGDTGLVSMLLLLPFMLALDVVTWYRVSRNQPVQPLLIAVVSTLVGCAAVLPQIALFLTDPILSIDNLPMIVAAMFVAAFVGHWMGGVIGSVVTRVTRIKLDVERPAIAKSAVWTVSAVGIVIVMIAVFFILTSTIPSA